ncbi:MAG: hypothetical protein KDD46_03660 [Bdellovibrionales bacterium]|nr:hypothetical protein [Bdellovibrionales bacterium]
MKKFAVFTLIALLPMVGFTQPVEEEITSDSPVYEIEVIESPTQVEKPQVIEPVQLGKETPTEVKTIEPIGEILTPAKVESVSEESSSGTKWNFAPGLSVSPLAYNGGEKQTYGEFSPNASLSSEFLTGTGKKVGFNLGYTFIWQEFYDKSQGTDRYFEHDTALGLSLDITDKFSSSLSLDFNYSLRANPSDREFTIFSPNSLYFSYKATNELTTTFGYAVDIFNFPDGAILGSDLGIPSDQDDVRQGDFTFDPTTSGAPLSSSTTEVLPNSWFMNNKARMGATYAIPKGPKVNLDYDYVFATLANNDAFDWKGHYIALKLSQSAWKGGSVSIKNQLRLQNFQTATIDSGALKKAQRNRTDLMISHQVTDNIGITAWYRLQMTHSNAGAKWTPTHFWFLQTSFSF